AARSAGERRGSCRSFPFDRWIGGATGRRFGRSDSHRAAGIQARLLEGVNSEGKIRVQKSHNCKTDCPACSRVCPEVAILFPKYKAGPINGDEVKQEDLAREKMKVDISALLGGDIYAALRDRSVAAKQ